MKRHPVCRERRKKKEPSVRKRLAEWRRRSARAHLLVLGEGRNVLLGAQPLVLVELELILPQNRLFKGGLAVFHPLPAALPSLARHAAFPPSLAGTMWPVRRPSQARAKMLRTGEPQRKLGCWRQGVRVAAAVAMAQQRREYEQRMAQKRADEVAAAEVGRPLLVRLLPKSVRSRYRAVVPRPVRVFLRERSRRFWVLFLAYGVGQWAAARVQFGLVFFILALVAGIFLSLEWNRTRPRGVLSAYSVFNPGQRRLAGELDAGEYDRMLRGGGVAPN